MQQSESCKKNEDNYEMQTEKITYFTMNSRKCKEMGKFKHTKRFKEQRIKALMNIIHLLQTCKETNDNKRVVTIMIETHKDRSKCMDSSV